ncbi:plastocyanin [Candidatus Nitrososphaera evergladensis SR1]|jgi:plastocyanin|uniref:Plastocyanin n=1 Tax=Candidatus Nitrososphaera evergladensis SR1 TaxID=1459636 RepID=A0A075MTR7_9ARCH|nr:plastocyanin/azurin family copper-binding protein [Candidatus Nitrososphaera evergladensis]AIF84538.1 plastocyanin [Candidatus Nitrososphaera evergladensis SR1]
MQVAKNHAGGIALTAFIAAVAVSLAYYQYVYVPEANRTPYVPPEIRNPEQTTHVTIVKDAGLESNPKHYDPMDVRAVLGLSNKVTWTNQDSTFHTVTTDDSENYVDAISGKFDSQAHLDETTNGFIAEGGSWSFTFTKEGDYHYHCVPHPFMQGVVHVVPNFS